MSSTSSKTSGFLGKPNLTPHGDLFANLLYMCCASYGFSPRNCSRCGVLGKVQTVPGCATKNNLKGQTANCLLIWKLSTCSWPDSSGAKQNQKYDLGMTVYCFFHDSSNSFDVRPAINAIERHLPWEDAWIFKTWWSEVAEPEPAKTRSFLRGKNWWSDYLIDRFRTIKLHPEISLDVWSEDIARSAWKSCNWKC